MDAGLTTPCPLKKLPISFIQWRTFWSDYISLKALSRISVSFICSLTFYWFPFFIDGWNLARWPHTSIMRCHKQLCSDLHFACTRSFVRLRLGVIIYYCFSSRHLMGEEFHKGTSLFSQSAFLSPGLPGHYWVGASASHENPISIKSLFNLEDQVIWMI